MKFSGGFALSVFACLLWGNTGACAQTVLLSGYPGTGSHEFARELTRIMESSGVTKAESYVVRPVKYAGERLQQLRNRQGDLAIIDAETAHRRMSNGIRLRVLTVLWPNWLHLIVNTLEIPQASFPGVRIVLAHSNAVEAVRTWKSDTPEGRYTWLDETPSAILENGFLQDALMIAAPVPVEELRGLLGRFQNLRLISPGDRFARLLRQDFPWWRLWKLPAGSYPGQVEEVQGVARFPVLVSRIDFDSRQAQLVLKRIYSQRMGLNPHVLFRNLDPEQNSIFQKSFHFHPQSRKFFRFE